MIEISSIIFDNNQTFHDIIIENIDKKINFFYSYYGSLFIDNNTMSGVYESKHHALSKNQHKLYDIPELESERDKIIRNYKIEKLLNI